MAISPRLQALINQSKARYVKERDRKIAVLTGTVDEQIDALFVEMGEKARLKVRRDKEKTASAGSLPEGWSDRQIDDIFRELDEVAGG